MEPGQIAPRLVEPRLEEALGDSPVVLIHGPRQSGKTTLAQRVGRKRRYAYFNLDDDVVRGAAEADPVGFVAGLPRRTILDEIQRVPKLFTALKATVDRDRQPGRFLLTGSANVLFVPRLADSLAGRMEIVRLFPFAQCEIEGRSPAFLDALFGARFKTRRVERIGPALAERIVAGGYPTALARRSHRRRAVWYRDYVETMVQRDARELARIASLDALPRLLALAAGQTAHLLNVTDLSAPFQLSRPTIRDYVTLLERVFLVEELPPWHTNRLSRLVKTPKLHVGDTGVAAALLGLDATALSEDRGTLGQLLETFVYQELRRQASGHDEEIRFHHFRDKDGYEVDVVLEQGGRRVAGVEVKAGATVTAADFRGLRRLASAAGRRFAAGVVLYDGETSAGFGDQLYAVPVGALWES
ncbi:MAG TPA: ATP-binding protein [Gemmatimonadaceae bacterium]|nr:ATP-binding protein [Gemmatimonadaceae bacterium]